MSPRKLGWAGYVFWLLGHAVLYWPDPCTTFTVRIVSPPVPVKVAVSPVLRACTRMSTRFPGRIRKLLGGFVNCGSYFIFSSRRRHTTLVSDWSSDVCSSD